MQILLPFFKIFFYRLYMPCKLRSFPAALRLSHWVLRFVSSSWMARPSQTWFLQIIQPGWFLLSHFLSLVLTQHTPSPAICFPAMLLYSHLWTSACGLERKDIKLSSAKLAVTSSIRDWRLPKSRSPRG